MKTKYLAAAVLIISACSKADDSAPATAETEKGDLAPNAAQIENVCSLVSDAEINEAVGAAVTGKSNSGSKTCLFKTADPVVYASVEIEKEGASAWRGVNAGDSLIDAPQDSLAGVGDSAFFGPRDRLYLMKGGTFIAVEGGFDDHARERGRKVARLIASKL